MATNRLTKVAAGLRVQSLHRHKQYQRMLAYLEGAGVRDARVQLDEALIELSQMRVPSKHTAEIDWVESKGDDSFVCTVNVTWKYIGQGALLDLLRGVRGFDKVLDKALSSPFSIEIFDSLQRVMGGPRGKRIWEEVAGDIDSYDRSSFDVQHLGLESWHTLYADGGFYDEAEMNTWEIRGPNMEFTLTLAGEVEIED
jgi:hypothetical protein